MLTYTVTPDDRAAFQLWGLEHFGQLAAQERRLIRRAGIAFGIGLLLPTVMVLAAGRGDWHATLVAAAIGTGAWFLVRPFTARLTHRWLLTRARRRIRSRLSRNRAQPTPLTLTVDADGFTLAQNGASDRVAWSALQVVDETAQYVYLTRSDLRTTIVPRRADPGRVAELAALARDRIDERKSGRLAAPGTQPAQPRAFGAEPAAAARWVPPTGVVPLSAFSTSLPAPAVATSEPPGVPALSYVATIDDVRAALLGDPRSRDPLLRQLSKYTDLSATVDALARRQLAARGQVRQIWVDGDGITVADAAVTRRVPWHQVGLIDTDDHGLLVLPSATFAVPRRLGHPAASLLGFVRSHARGDAPATRAPGAP
ncbi:MAG: YcxB family protein [Propionicimonas sp.]|uniref:YcxB family protein n=1 Tax=Propionicimonas sp. TaxID=1955623 RepID=UPI003D0B78BF